MSSRLLWQIYIFSMHQCEVKQHIILGIWFWGEWLGWLCYYPVMKWLGSAGVYMHNMGITEDGVMKNFKYLQKTHHFREMYAQLFVQKTALTDCVTLLCKAVLFLKVMLMFYHLLHGGELKNCWYDIFMWYHDWKSEK